MSVLAMAVVLTIAVEGEQRSGAADLEPESATELAQVSDFIEEAQTPGQIKPDRGAAVSEEPTIRERVETATEAGEEPEIGGELERVRRSAQCPQSARGAVVDVTVSGAAGCDSVAGLVERYSSGLSAGRMRPLGDFTCAPAADALQVSCTRAVDATTVVLVFGPGGRGLTDCGQSPIDEDASLARVRTRGLSCNGARTRVFAAMSAGDPTAVKGLRCNRRAVGGTDTVSCEGGGGAIAFTLPKGS